MITKNSELPLLENVNLNNNYTKIHSIIGRYLKMII